MTLIAYHNGRVFRVRARTRRMASPPPGFKRVWEEHQVWEGRKIVFRAGTEKEAKAWIEKQPRRA